MSIAATPRVNLVHHLRGRIRERTGRKLSEILATLAAISNAASTRLLASTRLQ